MNDAILKFRRYDDASLAYTGIRRHAADTRIGLMDSVVLVEARACPCEAEIPFGPYWQSLFVNACVTLMQFFFGSEWWPNGMEVGFPIMPALPLSG